MCLVLGWLGVPSSASSSRSEQPGERRVRHSSFLFFLELL